MGKSLTRKIIESHFVSGDMTPGKEIFIKVDQTLTHDINAVMTYLAFEAIGLDRVRTECSVSYLDHNLLYVDNKTPDDHIYLQSAAKKFGVYVSRPGNGICHTVHVSRFGVPGKVSMGGDSHTPHGGAIGMLCIGVGGMDVATAMTGVPMRLTMPESDRLRSTDHRQSPEDGHLHPEASPHIHRASADGTPAWKKPHRYSLHPHSHDVP
jgi:aconitate hydratase